MIEFDELVKVISEVYRANEEKANRLDQYIDLNREKTNRILTLELIVQHLVECPFRIDEATVPKAGIQAAPEQVVVNISLSWVWLERARLAMKEKL
jgi:hypothetical protein